MNFVLQASMREAACQGREIEHVGPFQATFTPSNANPFLNYAIPDENAAPSTDEIAALVSLYRRRGLLPRLEFIPSVAPLLEGILLSNGFAVEARMPLMICSPASVRDLPVPPGFELVQPTSDQELFAMLKAQNEAYGDLSFPTETDIQRRSMFLQSGGLAVLARVSATGEAAGGGVCNIPTRGVTELASVGVRAAFRRQGIAGAMTSWLVRQAFARDIQSVFLMAAGEAEARIYARAGFSHISEVVSMTYSSRA